MTTYYVDSNAGGANNGTSWTDAYLSFWSIPSTTLADTDIVYVASNHVEADTTASKTLTGPTVGYAQVISATSGTTTPAAGAQVKTTGGAYTMSLLNALYVYGVTFQAGGSYIDARGTSVSSNSAEALYESCTFVFAHAASLNHQNNPNANITFKNCTFDFSADTSNSANPYFNLRGPATFIGGSVVKGGTYNRTGSVVSAGSGTGQDMRFVGMDLSVIGSSNELGDSVTYGRLEFLGCKLPSGYLSSTTLTSAAITSAQGGLKVIDCGDTQDPRVYFKKDRNGLVEYSTTATRTDGASIEGSAVSWKITTTDKATEHFPFYTDWIYGSITTTGTKTFDVYIAHNAAGGGSGGDFYDSEIWLEVQYLDTSGSPLRTHATDHRSWASSPTEQTDDVASSWGGSPGSNLQKLSVASVSVDESGLYRARVAVGKASATVYVDPKVTVS